MGDISANFNRSEFECSCGCGGDTVDAATLEALEAVRQHYDAPVTINSAYRCLFYNRSDVVGSNDNSQHPKGRAVDFTVAGVLPADVYVYCDSLGLGGVGKYDDFTHIDTRDGYARW